MCFNGHLEAQANSETRKNHEAEHLPIKASGFIQEEATQYTQNQVRTNGGAKGNCDEHFQLSI